MRKFDKKIAMLKANILLEQRNLKQKGLIKENINEEDLAEVKYDKPWKELEGYIDAEELVGKHLWFHTNRTHRNNGYNGMIGVYTATEKGRKGSLTKKYTNEVRIKSPIHFQTSDSGSARIKKSKEEKGGAGERKLIAGVSGFVVPTGDGGSSGMIEAGFNPFDSVAPWFYLKNDADKKEIVSADEVFFHASKEGEWSFFIKGPKFSDRSGKQEEPELELEPEADELELDKEINETMKKNRILTESQKRQITENKEKAILESFASTFNKIKRIDESEINENSSDTYFETLSETLDYVREQVLKMGYTLDEDDLNFQFGTGGVSYGQTKSAVIPLLKNGEPILGKGGKPLNRGVNIVIYRMDSGRYELTFYKTF